MTTEHNLEGNLNGVEVGDLIILLGRDGRAAGFVCDITRTRVSLSPHDISSPANYRTYADVFPPPITDYYLRCFQGYQILRKNS